MKFNVAPELKWALRAAVVRYIAKYVEIDERLVMICVNTITRLMVVRRFPHIAYNQNICSVYASIRSDQTFNLSTKM